MVYDMYGYDKADTVTITSFYIAFINEVSAVLGLGIAMPDHQLNTDIMKRHKRHTFMTSPLTFIS
jgi:hypothetical protein